MMTSRSSLAGQICLLMALTWIACDRKPAVIAPSAVTSVNPAPVTSVNPAPIATSVKVGTLGGTATSMALGESLQLWAQASYSDDTTADVTNIVTWQSSDPSLATVTREGLLKAGSTEGSVEAIASMGKVSGTLRADIRRRGCEASTATPADFTFSAFGGNAFIAVTAAKTDCRWTATTDSDWLRFYDGSPGSDRWRYDPGRSGSGSFGYIVQPNNMLQARRGTLTVAFSDGGKLTSRIFQEPVASCSYVVSPDEVTQPKGTASTGVFDVIATPATCQWTATAPSYYNAYITEGASGTGNGRVRYAVSYPPYATDIPITIAGLSGTNPPAIYRIHVR